MEEKQRYRYLNAFSEIHDTQLNIWYRKDLIAELLNNLDKHIKELQEQCKTKDVINNLYKTTISLRDNDFKYLVYENNKLKQLQNQSVIKILKELNIELARNAYYSEDADDDVLDMYKLNLLFENKIKELEKKDDFL